MLTAAGTGAPNPGVKSRTAPSRSPEPPWQTRQDMIQPARTCPATSGSAAYSARRGLAADGRDVRFRLLCAALWTSGPRWPSSCSGAVVGRDPWAGVRDDGVAVFPAGPPEPLGDVCQLIAVAVRQVLPEHGAAWILVGGHEPAVEPASAGFGGSAEVRSSAGSGGITRRSMRQRWPLTSRPRQQMRPLAPGTTRWGRARRGGGCYRPANGATWATNSTMRRAVLRSGSRSGL